MPFRCSEEKYHVPYRAISRSLLYRSQHDGEQQVVALEPVPGKAVTRSSGEEEAEQHGEHGHDEAVEKVVGKIEVGELGEYVPVGVSVPPTRMAGVRYAR